MLNHPCVWNETNLDWCTNFLVHSWIWFLFDWKSFCPYSSGNWSVVFFFWYVLIHCYRRGAGLSLSVFRTVWRTLMLVIRWRPDRGGQWLLSKPGLSLSLSLGCFSLMGDRSHCHLCSSVHCFSGSCLHCWYTLDLIVVGHMYLGNHPFLLDFSGFFFFPTPGNVCFQSVPQ